MLRLKVMTISVIFSLLALFVLNVELTGAQSADEQAVLTLVNQERAAEGLAPYAWDSCLAAAATSHNNDMINNNFFAHIGSNGSEPTDRAVANGYPTGTWVGENIAVGFTTPADVVTAWMDSAGHRDAILDNYNAGHQYAGVSRVGNHWTINFGAVACSGGTSSTTGTTSTGSTTTGTTSTGSTSTGGTTTGSTTGGTTTGSTTTGSTSTGGTTTGGTTTGSTSTGSTTGGTTTGSISTGGSSTGGGSSSSSGTNTTNSNSTQTTTVRVPDDCASTGGDIQVSALSGMTCTTLTAAGVGNQSVLDRGFINGVDVWGNFTGIVEVCLRGSGSMIFMDAAGAPRVPQAINSVVINGMTCTTITRPGSVILVGSPNTAGQTTSNTQSIITTTSINADGNLLHIVQPGENLFRIGLRYGVPFQQIAAINGIGADYRIFVGQQLIIPQ